MEGNAIRVLQVVEGLNPGMGATRVAMNYQQYMDPSRVVFDYMVHVPPEEAFQRQVEQYGSKVYQMPSLSGKNTSQYRRRLHAFFQEHPEYQIIHGNLPNAGAFYLPAAQEAGVPFRILHSHNTAGSENAVKRARNALLNRKAVKSANLFFACSQKAADYLFGEEAGGRVILIRNAIDAAKYVFQRTKREEMRRQLGLEGRFVVGHVGRFCRQKNHGFLLEIFKQVASQEENATLLLVGEGVLQEETARRAQALGLEDRVVFAGFQDQVQDYLQAMDVFVLPSLFEGLPLVGVEAQASGLPCLLSDEITPDAKVTDHVAFLPLSGGAERWAESVCLFSHGYQRVDCGEMIRQAGYEISAEAEKLTRYYEKLLAGQ